MNYENEKQVLVAHSRVHWKAFVNMIMNLRVPYKEIFFYDMRRYKLFTLYLLVSCYLSDITNSNIGSESLKGITLNIKLVHGN
jgi:hypothetical protein